MKIMSKGIIILMIFIFYFGMVSYAFGYIDPGTGGMVLGSLWSVIAFALAIIGGVLAKYFINPIKRFISRLTRLFKKSGEETGSANSGSKISGGAEKQL